MNSKQLIREVAARQHISVAFATQVVRCAVEVIASELAADAAVSIPGFGVFHNRHWAAREARNPQTGESVHVPARLNPEWRSSPRLKARVNEAQGNPGLGHRWSRRTPTGREIVA